MALYTRYGAVLAVQDGLPGAYDRWACHTWLQDGSGFGQRILVWGADWA